MHATQESELTLSGLFTVTAAGSSDGRLPLSQALQLGLQVARMVAQAHDSGRVVGELNASRLRFAANGSVGLGAMRGAPLAPELLAGERPDRLSDVYAVGALLYRLLTGRDVKNQRVPEPPSHFNPAVDGELDEMILSALDEDPSARPISGRQLERGLLRVFEELDVEPSTAELQQVISEVRRKAPKKIAAAAPVAVAPVVAKKKAPTPAPRMVVVDEEDEEDFSTSSSRPSWLSPGPERTWLIRAAIALAVVVGLIAMWPGSKKHKVARPVDEVAVSKKVVAPKVAELTVAPVQAVPVADSLPAMTTKKIVYSNAAPAKKSRRAGR